MTGVQAVSRIGDLEVGRRAYIDASSIGIDAENNAFIDPAASAHTRSHLGRRVAVHRDGAAAWRVAIPWAALHRWEIPTATEATQAATGIPIADVIHYPLPWSRAVWAVANRNWLAGQAEDWLSERSRGPSWTLTALAWGVTLALGMPQLVTFALVFGISNIPPLHSAIECLMERSWVRFSRPGRFQRVRNRPGGGLASLPEHLVISAFREKTSVASKVVGYFEDFMSERSRIPQLTINWGITVAAFMVRIPPDFILAINWGVCQVSTVHSAIEAVRMRSMARFLRPTSFVRPKNAEYLFSSLERAPRELPAPDLDAAPVPLTVSVASAIVAAHERYSGIKRTRVAGKVRGRVVPSLLTATAGPAPVLSAATPLVDRGGLA